MTAPSGAEEVPDKSAVLYGKLTLDNQAGVQPDPFSGIIGQSEEPTNLAGESPIIVLWVAVFDGVSLRMGFELHGYVLLFGECAFLSFDVCLYAVEPLAVGRGGARPDRDPVIGKPFRQFLGRREGRAERSAFAGDFVQHQMGGFIFVPVRHVVFLPRAFAAPFLEGVLQLVIFAPAPASPHVSPAEALVPFRFAFLPIGECLGVAVEKRDVVASGVFWVVPGGGTFRASLAPIISSLSVCFFL